jgi:hypothetical protein
MMWAPWIVSFLLLAHFFRTPIFAAVALFPVFWLSLAAAYLLARLSAAWILRIPVGRLQIGPVLIDLHPLRVTLGAPAGAGFVQPARMPPPLQYALFLCSGPGALVVVAAICFSRRGAVSFTLLLGGLALLMLVVDLAPVLPAGLVYHNTMRALRELRRGPSGIAQRILAESAQGKRARDWSVTLAECVSAAETGDAWMILFAAVRAMDSDQPELAVQMIERGLALSDAPAAVRDDLALQGAMVQALVRGDSDRAAEFLGRVRLVAEPAYRLLAEATVHLAAGREPEARVAWVAWLENLRAAPALEAYRRGGNEWVLDRLTARLGERQLPSAAQRFRISR